MRLNKYIASCGFCSRRQADDLIRSGKVLLNDRMVKELGTQMDEQSDQVRIKGGPVLKTKTKKILLMLHKPKGYTCTRSDPYAKRTVYELLPPEYQHLNSVGRLDRDSEGLLLFTNDGDLANKLTHPKFGKEKVYLVTINGRINENDLDKIRKGMRLREFKTAPADVRELNYDENEKQATLEFRLKEGKKREIREIMIALKHPVKRLLRIKFGEYSLGGLKIGNIRLLS